MPEASLSCYTRQGTASPILSMEGCLDLANLEQAQKALQGFFVEHGPEIVIDTSRLDFIDSRGLGALLNVAKAARDAGGAVYLPHPAPPVRKILEACGLLTLFPEGPSANGAVKKPAAAEAEEPAPKKKPAARAAGTRAAAAKAPAGE